MHQIKKISGTPGNSAIDRLPLFSAAYTLGIVGGLDGYSNLDHATN